jgi:hypothetical protein
MAVSECDYFHFQDKDSRIQIPPSHRYGVAKADQTPTIPWKWIEKVIVLHRRALRFPNRGVTASTVSIDGILTLKTAFS